ncbi:hypothetical protein [Janibacter corallicola]|uniref:hypothetical protein n=1 Tax=Janibacter corallicola TaxID=415212 RepID=UPI00083213CB|nr:hypothetical protein [Janibacter corallicola]
MLSTFVAEATHHVELPVPPFVYGIVALLIFTVMLCALFSFRQAATKVPGKHNTVAHGEDHDETGDHH